MLKESDPNNSEAYLLRGKATYYMGNADQGLKLISRALQLDPDNERAQQFRKVLE